MKNRRFQIKADYIYICEIIDYNNIDNYDLLLKYANEYKIDKETVEYYKNINNPDKYDLANLGEWILNKIHPFIFLDMNEEVEI